MKYSLLSLMVGLLVTNFALAGKDQSISCKSQASARILSKTSKVVGQNSKEVVAKKHSARQ